MHLKQTWSFLLAACAALTACGGGDASVDTQIPSKHLLGVKVIGLATGYELVLQNNLSDDLTVQINGLFTFLQPVLHGSTYSVTVKSQPPGHECNVDGANTGTLVSDGSFVTIFCFTNGTVPPPPGAGAFIRAGRDTYAVGTITFELSSLPLHGLFSLI